MAHHCFSPLGQLLSHFGPSCSLLLNALFCCFTHFVYCILFFNAYKILRQCFEFQLFFEDFVSLFFSNASALPAGIGTNAGGMTECFSCSPDTGSESELEILENVYCISPLTGRCMRLCPNYGTHAWNWICFLVHTIEFLCSHVEHLCTVWTKAQVLKFYWHVAHRLMSFTTDF